MIEPNGYFPFQTGIAISPSPTKFGPLLFSGDLLNGLQALSSNGFECVELSLRSLSDIDAEKMKSLMKELDLQLSAVSTGQACLFDSLCLCAFDDDLRRSAVEHFKKISALAADLGTKKVIIGGIRGRLEGLPDRQMQQYGLGIQAIRECAQWLHNHGMTLLIEPINRYETNWILSTREGLAVLEEIDVSSAKLLLDVFHMNIEEASTVAALKAAGDKLGYVHFADNTRQAPGSGQIDFKSILKALQEIRYEGPIVAEILPLPDDLTAVRKTADFWQTVRDGLI